MWVKIKSQEEGLHPSEALIEISIKNGSEIVVVHPKSISNNMLKVGWPVAESEGFYLIELPRPSANGSWRLWIHGDDLIAEEILEKAVG